MISSCIYIQLWSYRDASKIFKVYLSIYKCTDVVNNYIRISTKNVAIPSMTNNSYLNPPRPAGNNTTELCRFYMW